MKKDLKKEYFAKMKETSESVYEEMVSLIKKEYG